MSGIRKQGPQIKAEIMQCLKEHGQLGATAISKITGTHRIVVWKNCNKLVAEGKLVCEARHHNAYYSLTNANDKDIADSAAKTVSRDTKSAGKA